jgi:hypothetical protein
MDIKYKNKIDTKLKKFNSNQLSILNHVVGDMIVYHQHREGGKCVKLMQDLLGNINKEMRGQREKGI